MSTSVISIGQTFSTKHETGCLALTDPDIAGEFRAVDGLGYELSFNVAMVATVDIGGYTYDADWFRP